MMKFYLLLTFIAAGAVMLSACSETQSETTNMSKNMKENPLFTESTLPFEAPDFDAIKPEHFRPAFETGMEQELNQMDSIAANSESPTFENTITAMEKSGALLRRTSSVFYNLTSANTSDKIQKIQSQMAPRLAAHSDDILLNPELYDRVKTLYDQRSELDLDGAQIKLLEDTHREFVRAGAELTDDEKARMREINKEISGLTTKFQENLLALNSERAVYVDDVKKLAATPTTLGNSGDQPCM